MDELFAFCRKLCLFISDIAEQDGTLSRDGRRQSSSDCREDDDSIFECGAPILDLLRRQAKILLRHHCDLTLLHRRLDDLMTLANGKFYAFPFKDVPECWRRLFTDASILKACSLVIFEDDAQSGQEPARNGNHRSLTSEDLDTIVKTLDLAIIMAGAPGAERREWIRKAMDLLESLCSRPFRSIEWPPLKRRKIDTQIEQDIFPSSCVWMPPNVFPVRRVSALSLQEFEQHMHQPRDATIGPVPLILENTIEHWPAHHERPWKRPDYLLFKTLSGRRLVPVEVGRSYVDVGWSQKIIPFREFMHKYILQSQPLSSFQANQSPTNTKAEEENSGSKGYLAQHDLFTQIPSLRADICIPDYCYLTPPSPHSSSPLSSQHGNLPTLEEPLLNAWFGPSGTISPMHCDPYHNILCQVVGSKYIRLYAPSESSKLYPRGIEDGGVDMSNTSALDIGVLEQWDGSEEEQKEAHMNYPLFKEASYVDVILGEGECLYIPVGWWHYVRSLSISFSVSFWWN